MIYVGIDPGLTGAWAVLWPELRSAGPGMSIEVTGRLTGHVDDFHTMGEGPLRRIHLHELWNQVSGQLDEIVCAIERAQPMPKQGVSSMFRYGAAYGAVLAAMDLALATIHLPTPAQWKKSLGLTGKGKEASRELALRLFPQFRDELKRKKDHNRAEALLLAEWARRRA